MNRVTQFLSDWPKPAPESSTRITAIEYCRSAAFDSPGAVGIPYLPVEVMLQEENGLVCLQIDGDEAIHDEHGRAVPFFITLRTPDALRALIVALTNVASNPVAAAILATLERSSETL